MRWFELRHIQDRAREAMEKELLQEALKKKAEELSKDFSAPVSTGRHDKKKKS